jgi:hypothetical protein
VKNRTIDSKKKKPLFSDDFKRTIIALRPGHANQRIAWQAGDSGGIRKPCASNSAGQKSKDGLFVVSIQSNMAKIEKYGTIVKVFLQSF